MKRSLRAALSSCLLAIPRWLQPADNAASTSTRWRRSRRVRPALRRWIGVLHAALHRWSQPYRRLPAACLLPARVRRRRPVVLGLEGLENRELLNASLVGDLTQLRTDLATATITLVNAATPSATNTPTLASVEGQFAKVSNVLAADWNQTWQEVVSTERAVLGVMQQELETLVQNAETQFNALGIRLPGQSPSTPSAADAPPAIVASPPPATSPTGVKPRPMVSPPPPTVGFVGGSNLITQEPNHTALIEVALSATSTQTVTVQYATSDGTATAGKDYTSTSGTLTFAPGTTAASFNVLTSDDGAVNEPNETVSLTLSNATNATITQGSAALTILEDSDGGTGMPNPSIGSPFPNCGCPNRPGSVKGDIADRLGYPPPPSSTMPVRYEDGVLTYAETDLHSSGFGFPWGQTRSWTNGPGYATNSDNGSGWVDTYIPHLLQADGSTSNTLILISNGETAYYYDLVGSSYQPRYDDGSKLSYNSSNDTYTIIDALGGQTVFNGFGTSRPAAQQGEFASYTSPDGVAISVTTYTSDGHLGEVQRSATSGSNTTIESYLYSYLPTGNANAGLLSGVTERTQVNGGAWSTIRQVQYAYYDGTQTYGGNLGDLMTATVLDGSNNVLETSYYRYYKSGEANGYTDGLKYVFNPQSYARLTAALGTNLSSLTDAQVAPYADYNYQYDSQQRVTQEIVAGAGSSTDTGGQGTYTYSYTNSSNTPGFNSWNTKTVVTAPDGSTDTVYTNFVAEVMLDDHYDAGSGVHTIDYYAYNNQAQLVLHAAPSAVSGYSDTYADLMNNQNGSYQYLNNTSGLITRYDFYTTTTATETAAGAVAKYLQDIQIQQGQTGTLIPQETVQYFAHAFGIQTIAPIATDTVYRNTDGTGGETTSYSYTWQSGTAHILSETDTAPTITAAENGPGTADVTTTYFDAYGNAQWVNDPDGFIHYAAFDPVTGALLTSIIDVDTSKTSEFSNLPTGWSTPSGGGLNLINQYQVDALGRATMVTSPGGNVTYFVYLDPQHEVRTYEGWNSSTNTTTGPTEVYREDWTNNYVETLTMTAAPHVTNGAPDGSEAISGLQKLSRDYMNAAGQVTSSEDYFNLGGLTYTASVLGTLNVNYYATQYAYDNRGRLVRTLTPNGTIYRTVYDSLDRPISDWVGTNDTPASGEWSPTNNTSPSNMVQVRGYQYDNGGAGDGNLTQVTDYPGGSAANRVSQIWYDWRDRPVASKSGVQASENDATNRPIIVNTYDNLDEVTQTQQYAGDGVTPSIAGGVLQPLSASLLRAQENFLYDEQGRVYQTQVFDVNPSTGAVSSSALTTNDYYDHRGNLIAESAPGGLWSKSSYDGAGRDTIAYTTDGAGGTAWSAAGSVTNDTVLEQSQTVYDADSNVIETISRQRFHNATGTGALGSPTSGIGARVYYAAAYYDNADRLTASVDVGTNGGTAWTRPSTVPASSSTMLVTSYAYNSMGLVQDVTDPMGLVNRTYYDSLGRVTQTIQDYTNGTETAESNISTEYGYDGNNNVTSVQADQPGGSYQKTAYVYGVTTAGGSGVNSNDILSAVQHPDPTSGNPSSSQQDSYLVNALGQVIQSTDRNGNVHQLTYDVLGRLTSDAVTTLGAGVDGSVRRIEYKYDSQGNNYLITSYDAATGGNIVNQVQRTFNGLGQLTNEYQSHSGAVNTSSTPQVQYAYTEMSGGQNNSRLTSMTYPSGYVLNFNYNTGLDSNISRLSSISDTSNTLESYKYLGLAPVVERDHPQNNVNLTYIQQTGDNNAITDGGDQYTGLDRFGRVIDQNWINGTTHASTDRFQYGYNADSDVLYRQNLVDAAMSELYSYDSLHQLTSFQRGTLNSTRNGLVGNPSHSQSWTPDALGNFSSVTTDGSTQTRTANQQNEYTSISGSGTITYDANGNITADGSGNTFVYDAWNRLVAVKNGSTTLAAYGYDGLGRRVTETHGSTTTDLYYSAGWQLLEERQGGVVQARYVWSPNGVDTLVLRDYSTQHNGVLDQRLYVQQDANGNVTALVDTSGNVVERYDYDPYGAVTVLNPDFSVRGSSSYSWSYFFQSKRYDGTVGLYDSRGRVYSPTLMRWLEQDPTGFDAGDTNLYRFIGNSPLGNTDPTGLDAKKKSPPAKEELGSTIYGDWTITQVNQFDVGNPYHSHVKITFLPRQSFVDSDEIAFVQIVRVVTKEGKVITGEGPTKVEKRLTRSGWAVDRQPRKYGWYGYRDNGKPTGKEAAGIEGSVEITPVTPGSTTGKCQAAILEDVPSDFAKFGGPKKGGSVYNVTWEFQTYAIAKSGKDKGKIYGGVSWGFTVGRLGGTLVSSERRIISIPTSEFRDAILAWDMQANDPNLNNRTHPQQVPLGTVISRFPPRPLASWYFSKVPLFWF